MIQALLDSCVILPMPLCDTLLRAAEKRFYRVHFSEKILDDVVRNLVLRRKKTEEKAKRHKQFILETFPEGLVPVPNHLIGQMTNDPGDHHVLAAAVAAEVDVIVTANLKDFPQESLDPWGIEVQHPDEFLCSLCDVHGDDLLYELVQEQASDCQKPPLTDLDILKRLEVQHPCFVSKILSYEYGQVVKCIATRVLTTVGDHAANGNRYYDGDFYKLSLVGGRVKILDKESDIERLNAYGGKTRAALRVKDVMCFQEVSQLLEEPSISKIS